MIPESYKNFYVNIDNKTLFIESESKERLKETPI